MPPAEAHAGVVLDAIVDFAVYWQLGILILQVFGRFPATLGPKTGPERRGSLEEFCDAIAIHSAATCRIHRFTYVKLVSLVQ